MAAAKRKRKKKKPQPMEKVLDSTNKHTLSPTHKKD